MARSRTASVVLGVAAIAAAAVLLALPRARGANPLPDAAGAPRAADPVRELNVGRAHVPTRTRAADPSRPAQGTIAPAPAPSPRGDPDSRRHPGPEAPIRGRVVETPDGPGIPRVDVFLGYTGTDARGRFSCEATTDADGAFIAQLPAWAVGEGVTCLASVVGPDKLMVRVFYGTVRARDGMLLVAGRRVVLSGRFDGSGMPPDTWDVRADFRDGFATVATMSFFASSQVGEDGRFAFVRHSVGLPERIGLHFTGRGRQITVRDEVPVDALVRGDYVLRPGGRTCSLIGVPGRTALVAIADDTGVVVEDNIPRDGLLRVWLQHGTYAVYGRLGRQTASGTLRCTPDGGEPQCALSFRHESGGEMVVRVATADGAPLAGARVALTPVDAPASVASFRASHRSTGRDGTCRLPLSDPGPLHLRVDGGAAGTASRFFDATAPGQVSVVLRAPCMLRVACIGPDLSDVPHARATWIAIADADGLVALRTHDGAELDGLAAGWHRVFVRGAGFYGEWDGMLEPGPNSVRIACGDPTWLTVQVAGDGHGASLVVDHPRWPRALARRWAQTIDGPGPHRLFAGDVQRAPVRVEGAHTATPVVAVRGAAAVLHLGR